MLHLAFSGDSGEAVGSAARCGTEEPPSSSCQPRYPRVRPDSGMFLGTPPSALQPHGGTITSSAALPFSRLNVVHCVVHCVVHLLGDLQLDSEVFQREGSLQESSDAEHAGSYSGVIRPVISSTGASSCFFTLKRGLILAAVAKPRSRTEHPPPPLLRATTKEEEETQALLGVSGKLLFPRSHPSYGCS